MGVKGAGWRNSFLQGVLRSSTIISETSAQRVVNAAYFLPILFLSRDSCINASTTQHSQKFVRRALDMPMGLKASSRGVGSDLYL